ncbi:hypothetical protein CBNA_1705 [Coxiella burnetii str. Namibia]|nr:hypothetical protein CBNA_1705 [Coxiella burnetii str. Namibia]
MVLRKDDTATLEVKKDESIFIRRPARVGVNYSVGWAELAKPNKKEENNAILQIILINSVCHFVM